ncbi:hypothetical protein ACFL6I_29060 [candidate division KSB1 bacterium]
MEEKILQQIKQIRVLLSELVGTSDMPASEKFSKEAISKAAKEYRKLAIERGQWLPDHDIDKVIKNAPWRAGKIIIRKFGFTNYFKRGSTYYFNRKDLIALNKELKKKNINLKEYAELQEDQEKFQKYLDSISTGKRKRFKIPEALKDINSKPYSPPLEELIKDEIKTMMEEFEKFNLSEYVSLYYSNTYAMFKYDYTFDRYLDPKLLSSVEIGVLSSIMQTML